MRLARTLWVGGMASMALGGALTTVAHDAKATTCGVIPETMVVPSIASPAAPRNVRPRITMRADWRTSLPCNRAFEAAPCPGGPFELELRRAGRGGAGADPIAVDMRESRSGDVATIELVPRTPLDANARYEIQQLDRTGTQPPRILSTFKTNASIDDKPPAWTGVTRYERVGRWPPSVVAPPSSSPSPPKPGAPSKKPPHGVVVIDMLEHCDGQGIDFYGSADVTDDMTSPADLRWAIWIAENTIDYSTPPLAYVLGQAEFWSRQRGREMKMEFGAAPSHSDFSFPEKLKVARIGVRLVDLAGNMSAPSEITFRVDRSAGP